MQPGPFQAIQNDLNSLIRRPVPVSVLDTEDKRSAFMPGKQPIKQGRPHPPNMEEAGRTWRKSYSYLTHTLSQTFLLTTNAHCLGDGYKQAFIIFINGARALIASLRLV